MLTMLEDLANEAFFSGLRIVFGSESDMELPCWNIEYVQKVEHD
jgi:hypothetical protein